MSGRRTRAWAALAAFALTLAGVSWSLLGHRQLGDLKGLSDTWLQMAVESAQAGDLVYAGTVSMYKPPGYPAFLQAVLWVVEHAPARLVAALAVPSEGDALLQRLGGPVYWAHGLVLALAAAAVCLWLSRFMSASLALAGAICFGVNPYVLTYVGTPHYAIPYMALIVVSCWASERALAADTGRWLTLVVAGLLWALTTLVRPVTLVLAPFLLAAFLWRCRPSWRTALLRAAVVLGALYLALVPWTARNYLLTRRIVPVSAQAWHNVWVASAVRSSPDPNHYRWKLIRGQYKRLLKREAPQTPNTDPYNLADNVRIDDICRRMAFENLRRAPGVYLANAAGSFFSYNVHINSILIGLYAYLQRPGARLKTWYWPGQSQEAYASLTTAAFVQLFHGLSLLALGGLIWALRRDGPPLLATVATHFCFAFAHSIVWMDTLYYSSKWPFLIVLAFAFIHWTLRSRSFALWGRSWRLGGVLGWALALTSVALTVALLL